MAGFELIVNMFDLLSVMTKLLIYLAVAVAIGGSMMLLIADRDEQARLLGYIRSGVLIGMLAVTVNFFSQVGAFAETGVTGMWDPMMMDLLWYSTVGDAAMLRITGLMLVLLATLLTKGFARLTRVGMIGMLALGCLLLGISFVLTGHSVEVGSLAQWLLCFHLLAIASWIGSLYPLWQMCTDLKGPKLQQRMEKFGRLASFIVATVLASGLGLLMLFFQALAEFVETDYGRAVIVKLMLVCLMLLLAALHKFRLVPALSNQAASRKLKVSIGVETCIAALILLLTAILSSVLGPSSLNG